MSQTTDYTQQGTKEVPWLAWEQKVVQRNQVLEYSVEFCQTNVYKVGFICRQRENTAKLYSESEGNRPVL